MRIRCPRCKDTYPRVVQIPPVQLVKHRDGRKFLRWSFLCLNCLITLCYDAKLK